MFLPSATLAVALSVVLNGLATASPISTLPSGDTSASSSKVSSQGAIEASMCVDRPPRSRLSALTLPDDIEYHVPHTSTTIFLSPYPSPLPYSALREITSRALAEVENILDIAGDGILPGSNHQYKKWVPITTAHGILEVQIIVDSAQLSTAAHHLMSYGVLRDALRGLLDFAREDRQKSKINIFRITHGHLGVVGVGYFTWEHTRLGASEAMVEPFSYRVPNTYTTLHLILNETPQYMVDTMRMLLSCSLFEAGSILQIDGDGILPGPEHGYQISQHAISGHTWERAELTIASSMARGDLDQLMTYQILHDTLQGFRLHRCAPYTVGDYLVHTTKTIGSSEDMDTSNDASNVTPEEALQYLHDLPETFSGPLTVGARNCRWTPRLA
ncbi:MAG: hypothetical protein Q9172_002782 [Xanthocarpia lactea]